MIRLGLGSSALLASSPTIPMFLANAANAMTADSGAMARGRILVVIQLDGGNDGLNTVVPYRDDEYRKHRPRLAITPGEVLKINDQLGFNRALASFSKLLEQHRLAIVQGVGYPNPNRSHFESMAIWHSARTPVEAAAPGWLARAIDARPNDHADTPALHIHDSLPLPGALAGGQHVVPSVARLEQFHRRLGMPAGTGEASAQIEALDRLARQNQGQPGSLLQFVERCNLVTYANSARLERVVATSIDTRAPGPNAFDLERRLGLIAQLIKAGLSTPIYYTNLAGFDTHSGQLIQHADLLRELGASLERFQGDLEKSGDADRVVVLVFSEFGRRLSENASGGTDHGTAAPVFLVGKPVKAGLHGKSPDLAKLDDGDPIHTVDFRQVYASLLDQWLGVPHPSILGERFQPIPVLA
jgi:uncharacterized protein (DUF1501 family)